LSPVVDGADQFRLAAEGLIDRLHRYGRVGGDGGDRGGAVAGAEELALRGFEYRLDSDRAVELLPPGAATTPS